MPAKRLELIKATRQKKFPYKLSSNSSFYISVCMDSNTEEKPHAVCIPYPTQGHINPMLRLAKLIHNLGFHITFVLTEYNYGRLVQSNGQDAVRGLSDFRFEAIPDGLPPSDENNATQDIFALCESTSKNCLPFFLRLIASRSPPVSRIISDGFMTFTLDAARQLGIPELLLFPTSAAFYLALNHYQDFLDRGLVPIKSSADLSNGYRNTKVDWIPGLIDGMALKDFPSFIRATDPNDIMFNFLLHEASRATMADGIIINTFEEFEAPSLAALQKILPSIYTIGPLSAISRRAIPKESPLAAINTNLWKEDNGCLRWLEGKKGRSVVYVNFGSITVMSSQQLIEFAWGLANSGYSFLWVIRPDLVKGDSAVLPPEFLRVVKERGLMVDWCAQEEILMHPAIGVFLTHCGWNSTLESICGGVPMICWPFFADQQMNCKYACDVWGVGLEIDNNVKRMEVEELIREVMERERGKRMRERALEWKGKVAKALESHHGSSATDFNRLSHELLGRK